jgi:hypothetical protein
MQIHAQVNFPIKNLDMKSFTTKKNTPSEEVKRSPQIEFSFCYCSSFRLVSDFLALVLFLFSASLVYAHQEAGNKFFHH